jgi:glutaredoxin-related protein
MFGEIPADGFFIRHAKGIEFDNVQVSYINEDFRPPFILNSVTQAEFNDVKGQHASGVPTLVMKDVDGFKVHDSRFMPDTRLGAVKDNQF